MKSFSVLVNEAKINNKVATKDINAYAAKLQGQIPNGVMIALNKCVEYGIEDAKTLEGIMTANKSSISKFVDQLGVSTDELFELQDLLKKNKQYLKVLPMYHSDEVIKAVQTGKLKADDLMLDLTTPKGKNQAAKDYMPVVYKIVNQYQGRSRLSHGDLMSAALEIMSKAMTKWSVEPKDGKISGFAQYLAFMLKFELQNEMGRNGHSLSGTNNAAYSKYGAAALDAISIDHLGGNGDEFNQDHLAALGMEDEMDPDEKSSWEDLYKEMEKQFSQRDCDIFFRYFGLNGRKKEKAKDIAKMYGMSAGNINNSVLLRIMKWLKKNPKAIKILRDLADMYNESLMTQIWMMDREHILETLVNDDVFILLEKMVPWKNRHEFNNAIALAKTGMSKKDSALIDDIVSGGFADIDDNLKTSKGLIVDFMSQLYPTENFDLKTDIGLLDKVRELQRYYNEFNK